MFGSRPAEQARLVVFGDRARACMKKFLKVIVIVAGLIATGFYFLRIHRYEKHEARDSWVLEMNYPLMGCRHCLGEITRLECQGKPVLPLKGRIKDGWRLCMIRSPVGSFEGRSHND